MLPTYDEVKQSVAGAVEELESLRKPIRAKRQMYNWLLLATVVLAILLFLTAPILLIPSVVIVVVMLILWYRNWSRGGSHYRAMFKQLVVVPLMQTMLERCSLPNETEEYEYYCKYSPDARIDDRWIQKSRLYDIDIDEVHGEDLFRGRLGLTDFMFSELRLVQERRTTDSKGNTTTTRVDMFKGILFIADFHKDFEGITILDSNVGKGGFFGRMLGRLSSTSYTPPIKMMLEDEAFNEAFQVRTTDEIKARYILSSSMMERILAFKRRHKEKISISFVDSFMCVSMWSSKNYFESKLSKPVTGAHLEAIYEDLKFLFGWIEAFNLNTRIWSKE